MTFVLKRKPPITIDTDAVDAVMKPLCDALADERAAIYATAHLRGILAGEVMPDGTIYLGVYTPKDRDGKSLSKTFNVFAAPQDLPETMKYVDAVGYIAASETGMVMTVRIT